MDFPIVFLHGFPLGGCMWQPQVDHFKKMTTVFAPDLRGHGDGPWGEGPWFMDHYVEDLLNLLEAHGVKKIVLCGLSMGGYVALQFIRDFPERVHALVLCDTQAQSDSNDVKRMRFNSVQEIYKNGLFDFGHSFLIKALSASTRQMHPQLHKELEEMIQRNNPADIALVLGALASRPEYNSLLSQIRCPTLVLAGSEDIITSPKINEELAENIPGALYKVIPSAGHLSNLEQPEVFNDLLAHFLSSLESSAGRDLSQ